jgi:hypothetical protein
MPENRKQTDQPDPDREGYQPIREPKEDRNGGQKREDPKRLPEEEHTRG